VKRNVATILIALILVGLAAPLIGCGSESNGAEALESQIITVQRGELTVDITASGNLALSLKEDVAFEVGGTELDPVTVEEVLVEEGDSVTEGQVLARVDTTYLEETVKEAERSLRAAEIDLEKATDNYREMTYPYTYSTFAFDVPSAVVAIHDAEVELGKIRDLLDMGLGPEQYAEVSWQLNLAQDNLEQASALLRRGVGVDLFPNYYSGGDSPLAVADFWTLRAAQLDMDKAQLDLDKAMDDMDTAGEKLEKAEVVALFDGFITTVNVEGGDEVKRGTVAVQLADPNRFEAEVMVNEMDIFQVRLGGDATVQIDAMSALILPAKVTHVSPTATIESGVVNYKVKVELQSLEALMQERQKTMQEAVQDIASGALPERLRQAIEEGQITQEQAEEMMEQMQQAQGGQQGQIPTAIPEDFQLREGLTVTVSIIVDERNDVLLVPNSAITTQGWQNYVQVLSPDGTIEERAIATGISNWQYTEVTDGLSEGEQVVVPQGTATTTTPQQQGHPGGMVPGMGRILR